MSTWTPIELTTEIHHLEEDVETADDISVYEKPSTAEDIHARISGASMRPSSLYAGQPKHIRPNATSHKPILEDLHEHPVDEEEYDQLSGSGSDTDLVRSPPTSPLPSHQPLTPGSDYSYSKSRDIEGRRRPNGYYDPVHEYDLGRMSELGRAEQTDRAQGPSTSRAYPDNYGRHIYAAREDYQLNHQRKPESVLPPSPPLSPASPVNSHPPSGSSDVFPHVPSRSELRDHSPSRNMSQFKARSIYDMDATSSSFAKVDARSAPEHRASLFEQSSHRYADHAEQILGVGSYHYRDRGRNIAVEGDRDPYYLFSRSRERERHTYDRENEHEYDRNRPDKRYMHSERDHNYPSGTRKHPSHRLYLDHTSSRDHSDLQASSSRDADENTKTLSYSHPPPRPDFALHRAPAPARRPRTPEYAYGTSHPSFIPRNSPDARDERSCYDTQKHSLHPRHHQRGTSKRRRSTSPDEPVAKPRISAGSGGGVDKIRGLRNMGKAERIMHTYETTIPGAPSAGPSSTNAITGVVRATTGPAPLRPKASKMSQPPRDQNSTETPKVSKDEIDIISPFAVARLLRRPAREHGLPGLPDPRGQPDPHYQAHAHAHAQGPSSLSAAPRDYEQIVKLAQKDPEASGRPIWKTSARAVCMWATKRAQPTTTEMDADVILVADSKGTTEGHSKDNADGQDTTKDLSQAPIAVLAPEADDQTQVPCGVLVDKEGWRNHMRDAHGFGSGMTDLNCHWMGPCELQHQPSTTATTITGHAPASTFVSASTSNPASASSLSSADGPPPTSISSSQNTKQSAQRELAAYGNLYKHVLNMHFALDWRECVLCTQIFARADATKRHFGTQVCLRNRERHLRSIDDQRRDPSRRVWYPQPPLGRPGSREGQGTLGDMDDVKPIEMEIIKEESDRAASVESED